MSDVARALCSLLSALFLIVLANANANAQSSTEFVGSPTVTFGDVPQPPAADDQLLVMRLDAAGAFNLKRTIGRQGYASSFVPFDDEPTIAVLFPVTIVAANVTINLANVRAAMQEQRFPADNRTVVRFELVRLPDRPATETLKARDGTPDAVQIGTPSTIDVPLFAAAAPTPVVLRFGTAPPTPGPEETNSDVRILNSGDHAGPFLFDLTTMVGRSDDASSFVAFATKPTEEILVPVDQTTALFQVRVDLARQAAAQQNFAQDDKTVVRVELSINFGSSPVPLRIDGPSVQQFSLYPAPPPAPILSYTAGERRVARGSLSLIYNGRVTNAFTENFGATTRLSVGRKGDESSFVSVNPDVDSWTFGPPAGTFTHIQSVGVVEAAADARGFARDENTVVRFELELEAAAKARGITVAEPAVIETPLYEPLVLDTTLTLVARTTRGGAVTLPFVVTGPNSYRQAVSLSNNNNAQTRALEGLTAGAYTIVVPTVDGWAETSATCAQNGQNLTLTRTAGNITINVLDGSATTCEFAFDPMLPTVAIKFVEFDENTGAVFRVLTGDPTANTQGPTVSQDVAVQIRTSALQLNEAGTTLNGGTEKVSLTTVTIPSGAREADFTVSASELTDAGFAFGGRTQLRAAIQPPSNPPAYQIRDQVGMVAVRLGLPPRRGQVNLIVRRSSGEGALVVPATFSQQRRRRPSEFEFADVSRELQFGDRVLQNNVAFRDIETDVYERYALIVTIPDGWQRADGDDAVSCADSDGVNVTTTRQTATKLSISFTLAMGAQATCTFNLAKTPEPDWQPEPKPEPESAEIRIVKQVTGRDGTFGYRIVRSVGGTSAGLTTFATQVRATAGTAVAGSINVGLGAITITE
ncbi:MAG: hypothetical protein GDA50_04365, partial [Alphaproteobacteria bacterium GM202ARS2]|nr:hypothetical protein [Alphaproteobacteria bacterium GM202ARS2]